MVDAALGADAETGDPRQPVGYRPGDLVVARNGYPTLYEVLTVCADGLLRLRGVDWAVGYSALVAAAQVRPATGILREE